jgi:hypothetical protein
MRVSIGQAAADALVAWLKQSLSPDIRCYAHWPQAGTDIQGREVSIIPVGRRTRIEGYGTFQVAGRSDISATQARIQIRDGDISQHMQLDVWADSQEGRDDVISQLDDILHAGKASTLNVKNSIQTVVSNPYNDELVLPFGEATEFAGNNCTFQFDDIVIDDTPDSIQRCEYRATALGDSRMPHIVTRTVPRLIAATFKAQTTESPIPPSLSVLPYDTTTLTPTGVLHGKSNS